MPDCARYHTIAETKGEKEHAGNALQDVIDKTGYIFSRSI